VIDRAPDAVAADEAVLVPALAEGVRGAAAFLRDERGLVRRVSWERDEADRRRALPAGTYELVGYRLLARDAAGVAWHVSAGGKTLRTLELAAGEETRLELDPTIHLQRRLNGRAVEVAVQGEAQSGLSIYRDGKRIPLAYRVLDARGAVLAEGPITYG